MKNHPTHKKIRKTDKSQTFNMQSSALGLLITLIIAIALLLLGSLVAYYSNDPSAFIEPIGYVTPFISAILGGFACSKLNTLWGTRRSASSAPLERMDVRCFFGTIKAVLKSDGVVEGGTGELKKSEENKKETI